MQTTIDMVELKSLKHAIEIGRKHLLVMNAMARRLKVPNKLSNFSQSYKRMEAPNANSQEVMPNSYQKSPIRLLTSAEMAARKDKRVMFQL